MILKAADTLIARRYALHEVIGKGSMGVVYRATDRVSGAQVALKRVTTSAERMQHAMRADDSTQLRLALAREFQLLASMRHPHVIGVLDYGFDVERQPYFTMELLDQPRPITTAGADLPLDRQLSLIIQILRALVYTHRRSIIHRDLKPNNVLVTGESVRVLDFGLAIMRVGGTQEHGTSGTLAYMAPEVLTGEPAGERSDLYSVGVILYELVSGRHPFNTEDIGVLVNQIMTEPPDTVDLPVPFAVAQVIERLMAKHPDERYPDAQTTIAALCAAADMPLPAETSAIRESFLQAAAFVGRDAELAQLSDGLRAAAHGHGSAWLVGGESGVGKSRLLAELRTQALVGGASLPPALVLTGQAVREGGAAFQMWRDALRPLVALSPLDDFEASVLRTVVPDAARILVRLVSEVAPLDPKAEQIRLFSTIAGVLRRQPQPVVIILEDAQWAGAEDLTLLAWLARVAGELPLLLVASFRDDERPTLPDELPAMRLLSLPRLSADAIRALSGSILGTAGTQPQVVDLLQRETEGNVFFLVEVVRTLAQQFGQLDAIGHETLPQRVFSGGMDQVIERRLNQLPDDARPLVNAAAVIGRQIDLALMRVIAPDADLDEWIVAVTNAAVFTATEGVVRFAHDKLREGVLARLSDASVRALNASAAAAIERVYPDDPAYYAALALHFRAARLDDREAHYAGLAGERALEVSNFPEAVRLLERATALVSSNARRMASLLRLLADAYMGMSNSDQAKTQYENALALARLLRDNAGIARALLGLGMVADAHGDYRQAEAHFNASQTMAWAAGDLEDAARALDGLSNVTYRMGDYARSRELGLLALEQYRKIGSQVGIADALKGLGSTVASLGSTAEAEDYYHQALAIYRELGQRRGISQCLNNLGVIAMYAGRLGEARQHYMESLEIKTEIGDRRGQSSTLNNLSIIAFQLGDYHESQSALEVSLAISREIGDQQGVADNLINLGRTVSALGNKAEARRLFDESLALCRMLGDQWGVAIALLNLGELTRSAGGAPEAALRYLDEALAVAITLQKPSTLASLLVEMALTLADADPPLALALVSSALASEMLESEYKGYGERLREMLVAGLTPAAQAEAAARFADLDAAAAYMAGRGAG